MTLEKENLWFWTDFRPRISKCITYAQTNWRGNVCVFMCVFYIHANSFRLL